MTVLIDTDVCIDVLRARDPEVANRLQGFGRIAVSSVSVAELAYGSARSSDPDRNATEVRGLLAATDQLDFTAYDAWHAGEIRGHLAAIGLMIGPYDLLIAAQARARGLDLITGNLEEFARVPGLRVLAWR